jgi:exonuclease III
MRPAAHPVEGPAAHHPARRPAAHPTERQEGHQSARRPAAHSVEHSVEPRSVELESFPAHHDANIFPSALPLRLHGISQVTHHNMHRQPVEQAGAQPVELSSVEIESVTTQQDTPILPPALCFVLSGPSETICNRRNALRAFQADIETLGVFQVARYERHRRKRDGTPFLVLWVKQKVHIHKIWHLGTTAFVKKCNTQLTRFHCRVTPAFNADWMQFPPLDHRNKPITRDTPNQLPSLLSENRFTLLAQPHPEQSPVGQPTPQNATTATNQPQNDKPSTSTPRRPQAPTPTTNPTHSRNGSSRNTRSNIRFGTWNIRGLQPSTHPEKPHEIALTLSQHDIDLCAVQETWLDDNTPPAELADYDMITEVGYSTASRTGGGTGFLFRSNIELSIKKLNWQQKQLKSACWIKVNKPTSHGKRSCTLIASVYLRPTSAQHTIEAYQTELAHLEEDIRHWRNKDFTVVICGDFNARIGQDDKEGSHVPHFGEDTRNNQGNDLINLMERCNIFCLNNRIAPTQYTCIRSQGMSVVDYLLVTPNLLKTAHSTTTSYAADTISDHAILHTTLPILKTKLKQPRRPKQLRWRTSRLQRKETREAYQAELKEHMANFEATLLENNTIDNIASQFCESITISAMNTIGKKCTGGKPRVAWWTASYTTQVKKCNELYEKVVRSKTRHDWHAFAEARKQKNKLKRELQKQFKAELALRASNVWDEDPGSKEAWQAAKHLRVSSSGSHTASNTHPASASSDNETCMQTFKDHFRTLSTQGPISGEDDFDFQYAQMVLRAVNEWRESGEAHEEQDMDISLEEVESAVSALPTRKAGDHEDIVAELIKYGGSELHKTLLKLLNAVWQSETIPQSWKRGTIIPLHKSGDCSNPGNYRGITLIAILRKILSIIILKRLEHHVHLHESQAAFRENRSCEDQVYMLTTIAQSALHAGVPLFIFFLDVRKAYDTVWRDALFYKLFKKGVQGKLARVIWEMMDKTASRLSMGGQCSDYFDVNIGVGQGDPLSTYLFNVFIDDLLERLASQPRETKIPLVSSDNPHCAIANLTYADDVGAISPSALGLQSHIDVIAGWMRQNRCRPNVEKSKVMVVNPTRASTIPTFTMCGQTLERVTTFKYLGIWFSEKGNWDDHTKYVLQRMNQAFCAWYPIFRCERLPVRVRLMMVRTFIYTAVQYCSSSWEPTKIVAEKMDTVARKALRVIFKLHPKDVNGEVLFGDSGMLPPSLLIQASKLVWNERILKLPQERWISSQNKVAMVGSRGVGRPMVGTNWQQSVSQILSNIRHHLNIASPDQPAHAQSSANRRSARLSRNPLASAPQPNVLTSSTISSDPTNQTESTRTVAYTNLWATFLKELYDKRYRARSDQRAPWCIQILQREGFGRAAFLDVLPAQLCRFVLSARSGRVCSLENSWADKCAGTGLDWTSCPRCGEPLKNSVDACTHRLLFCRRLPVGVENVEWTMLETMLAQVSEDFQDMLPGSVHAGDCNEFFLAKLLSPPTLSSVLLKQYWFSVCKLLGQQFIVSPCLQVISETSRRQDHMDASGERCSDGVVGNALIHHSTIAECDHTHASYVDTRFVCHSQVASQGTGAVNVRNADMAMY